MSETLDKLMLDTAAGSQSAFRLLATQLGGQMYRLAYRLLNQDAALADDAVQDALIKLWQKAPHWRVENKVQNYVARLVYTACMDILRKRKPTSILPEFLQQPAVALRNLIQREESQTLLETVNQLPGKQKDAILLFYFDDCTNKQIAEILGVSEKAVESLLVRARKKMAVLLPPELKTQRVKG